MRKHDHRPDRRQLLRGLCCAAASTALAPSLCACAAHAARSAGTAGDKGHVLKPIGGGLYWVSDGAYSAMFLVSSAGVIACDAPPTLGANYLKAIAEVTDKPVTHLVYSHEHVDHIAGSGIFPGDVTIIAHRETARLLAQRGDPRRRLPTVTFDDRHTLELGGERLELAFRGVNHSVDNIFIHAPRQRTLMLIDVIYPGWMPYKNLGVAVDVPGFVRAHRDVLGYDFDTLVAGHVDRPGTRHDVLAQAELVRDLAEAAERAYAALSFPAYLREHPPGTNGKAAWDLHNDYEQVLVDRMAAELRPKWQDRLKGTDTYLRDNCWAMLETYVVQGKPDLSVLPRG